MNTAEVAIEQLVAGVLALIVLMLPFVDPSFGVYLGRAEVAVPLLGAAYLLGVIVDKFVDALLGGLERLHRVKAAQQYASRGSHGSDPFPQDEFESELRKGDAAAAWMAHLRTRVRLARTVAVLAPLAALATSIACIRGAEMSLVEHRSACATRMWECLAVPDTALEWGRPCLPLMAFVVGIALIPLCGKLPRTDEWLFEKDRTPRLRADAKIGEGEAKRRQWLRWMRHMSPWLAVLIGSVVMSAAITWNATNGAQVLAIAGLAVGVAAFWAWRRILTSYMSFVATARAAARNGE